MKHITVKDILDITNGELIIGNIDYICNLFSKDTRTIKKGDTYIGIKGTNFDGSLFWKTAFENGADCAIVENVDFSKEDKNQFTNKTIIKVQNTLEALYEIARFKRNLYNIPVIAVTGSVGKTSTKDLVSQVVSEKFKTLKTLSNNNNNIGLPFTILGLENHEALVVEMGMNHFGEISLLSSIAKPNICIITNIGTSHIGNLGSRENILKAKLEILENSENPTIIINNDNDLLHDWYIKNKQNFNILTYGVYNKSDIYAENINLSDKSSTFYYKDKKFTVPVGGEHFVLNALCAIAVGETLNIELGHIIDGIIKTEFSKERIDIKELQNGITIINDTYNASLESIKADLNYMKELEATKKIAVLGDILELGEFAQELHEKVGTEVAKSDIDVLICYGENAKHIALQAEKEGMSSSNIHYIKKREEILTCLKHIASKGDIVLFKASHGMNFSELAISVQNIEFWK